MGVLGVKGCGAIYIIIQTSALLSSIQTKWFAGSGVGLRVWGFGSSGFGSSGFRGNNIIVQISAWVSSIQQSGSRV